LKKRRIQPVSNFILLLKASADLLTVFEFENMTSSGHNSSGKDFKDDKTATSTSKKTRAILEAWTLYILFKPNCCNPVFQRAKSKIAYT
jgi:hypothetical protein